MTNEPTSDLPKLSAPARRALARAGYRTLQQLSQATESEIANLHGMGPNTIKTLRNSLQQHGLSFKA